MYSTSITDEHSKKIIIALTNIIRDELVTTTDDIEANALREMGIRIKSDTKLLNAIIEFNESFLDLNNSWYSSSPSTSNSHVLARMLLKLMP